MRDQQTTEMIKSQSRMIDFCWQVEKQILFQVSRLQVERRREGRTEGELLEERKVGRAEEPNRFKVERRKLRCRLSSSKLQVQRQQPQPTKSIAV